MSDLTNSQPWINLINHKNRLANQKLEDLFNLDQKRADNYSISFDDIYLDYSKNIIDEQVISQLLDLARLSGLQDKIAAMFRGDKINFTENRSVLHTALRDSTDEPLVVDGRDVKKDIKEVLKKMEGFADLINNQQLFGFSGKPIKNIVNIGIGGSDLGPLMATSALFNYSNKNLKVRFVSNIDLNSLQNSVGDLMPDETLFIVSSKTFTTDETMTNALSAKQWIIDSLGETAVNKHFVAVSTNRQEVMSFGIDAENMFEFWDFVGGRYSLCSAIGLSLMIAIGSSNFYDMLGGFYVVDQHFRTTPFEENIPVLLALISVWYINFWGVSSEAVVPYNENLAHLSNYLQQLSMESNGKSYDIDGSPVDYDTGSVIWGSQGTNAQHAYFQLFHQGTRLIPIDLIGFVESDFENDNKHQTKLLANLLAQSRALAFGNKSDDSNVFESMPGNRPNNVLLFPKLSPKTLGQLLAIYEHKVFVEGVIWRINSFDQFGVNLGKQIAKSIFGDLDRKNQSDLNYDNSTNRLIRRIIGK